MSRRSAAAAPALLLALLAALQAPDRAAPQEPAAASPRLQAWDVFLDAGGRRIAAWQFEWRIDGGGARIVGLEGGEPGAFADAPYYDPAALQGGRIVVAAFSTADELPRGRFRAARVHLIVDAGARPRFDVELQACAGADGSAIDATIDTSRTP